MLSNIRKFENIDYPFPEQQILQRLGYRSGRTLVTESSQKHLRDWLQQARAVCRPRACAGTLPVRECTADSVLLTDGTALNSRSLARFLQHAQLVWLVCITLGEELPALSRQALDGGDGAAALIVDAAGSECVEAALDSLQEFSRREFLRQGLFLDQRRFSAGYGDWPVTDQSHFFRWFPLAEMGLRLSCAGAIEPEKTITAIAGIRRQEGHNDPQ